MTGFVTLKRVAQEAGVSVYSASRALNGLDGVSDATRARVRAVAKDLGYVPNRTAQMLRGEGTRTVGILTAKSENVYYAKLVAGIEDVVRPAGYHTLTADATDGEAYSQHREAEFIETMLELRVAAVILSYRIRSENLVRLLERQIPVVFVDCTPPDEFSHLPSAMGNGEDISRDVGRHFAEHGYRNWAFLGHTAGWPTREGRQRGLTTAAAEAEATLQIIEGSNSIETAQGAVAAFLRTDEGRAMDALYCSNELLINGAIRALRREGIRIGQDIGLIGFDDFDWAPAFDVPITVVDQQTREIGRHAGALVLAARGEEDAPTAPMPVPALVLRESCGCSA
ncbi:MAG TPA: LacI family DNA-binding transcriptional regulator [Arachnia sp.]|nr:LacI family DNA-binding transcriptional regulator [Arachnia sp.]